jgi:Immunity protein 53
MAQLHPFDKLAAWYEMQCNGDWEHTFGIKFATLDNPGWALTIDLKGTDFENVEVPFSRRESGDEWIMYKVEQGVFDGAADPNNVTQLIELFFEAVKSSP